MSDVANGQKILLLNHNLRGVGTYFRCWHLARQLVKFGYEVTLLTGSPTRRVFPAPYERDGVSIVETPSFLNKFFALGSGYGAIGIPYRILYALHREFDLVHSFDHRPNVLFPAIFRNRFKHTPLVADWCDWWGITSDGSGLQERSSRPVAAFETAMEDYIHVEADWVTTISTGLRDRAISLGISPEKVTWIPSGSPVDAIQPMAGAACKERLGIPRDVFLLGHVGIGERDLAMIGPGFSALRTRRPQVRLGMIGPAEKPRDLVETDTTSGVILFGRVPFSQLPVYLGACDAFLLPLRDTVFNRTRWPNKFGDYLAAGRPVLCSNVGDVPAIVETEGCGFVWNDTSELGDRIENLVEDASLCLRMGERARQLAEGRLSWQTLALQFTEVYRKVCA